MRCARAQQLMVAAVDRELAPRRQRALDRHLTGCATCQRELQLTANVLHAVERLPSETQVPLGLEQRTFRQVRIAAAEMAERSRSRWTRWLAVPSLALATVAAVVFAIGLLREPPGETAKPSVTAVPPPTGPQLAARQPQPPAAEPHETPPPAVAAVTAPPKEPPAELAASPDLFVELPILRNMEKLDHFEAIRTTTLDGQAPGAGEDASNG